MQTILGAGGAIGTELAKALPEYTDTIRLVSRNPKKVNANDQLMAADITNADAVEAAVKGSNIVYVTVGFPYKASVWQKTWLPVMRSVVDACQTHRAKLVFFDNVYMYDPAHIPHMTEDAPYAPSSQKGAVRKQVAELVMNAAAKGDIHALIARSADFYGPGHIDVSVLTQTVFDKLAAGKTAQWLASAKHPHAFTYTADAGRATALLGNTEDAYGQVWHLPTAADPPTGEQWVDKAAAALGAKSKVQVLPNWGITAMGLFMPLMRELAEMSYQYDRPYIFNSDKFSKRFGMQTTPYDTGIQTIVDEDYQS
jgi:nucleoside-diphosphate-sugar epimerase